MWRVLQHLQLASYQIFEHLVLLNFVFPDYFNGTFQVGQTVNRYSYLPKTTLPNYSTDFVSEFYVQNFFESLEVLEIQYMEKLVVGRHIDVDGREFTNVVYAAVLGQDSKFVLKAARDGNSIDIFLRPLLDFVLLLLDLLSHLVDLLSRSTLHVYNLLLLMGHFCLRVDDDLVDLVSTALQSFHSSLESAYVLTSFNMLCQRLFYSSVAPASCTTRLLRRVVYLRHFYLQNATFLDDEFVVFFWANIFAAAASQSIAH